MQSRLHFARLTALLGAISFLSPSAAALADTPASGFAIAPLFQPGSPSATLSNGDVIAFDGLAIERYSASGALLATLGTFPAPVFTGILAVDPTETFAVLGESTNGDVFRVDLAVGGMTFLANVVFNYDAEFEPSGTVVVSAATCGFGCGNDLIRLDPLTGATTPLALVSGPSGPLAIDAAGNLFYASQDPGFPTPPGSIEVIGFVASQLTGSVLLGDGDAFTVATGFDGGGSLAVDPLTGRLYMAENNFGTGANRVFEVGASAALSKIVVEGPTFGWISNLEFLAGTGPATFQAYQPSGGGRLIYGSTDFSSYDERNVLAPARPTASLAGAGLTGPGRVTLAIDGAAPLGKALVFYCPSSLYAPSEYALLLSGIPPLFTGLDPSIHFLLPGALSLDATGHASITGTNPGGLEGTTAFQALVLDAGFAIVGTSTAAFL